MILTNAWQARYIHSTGLVFPDLEHLLSTTAPGHYRRTRTPPAERLIRTQPDGRAYVKCSTCFILHRQDWDRGYGAAYDSLPGKPAALRTYQLFTRPVTFVGRGHWGPTFKNLPDVRCYPFLRDAKYSQSKNRNLVPSI